MNRTTVQEALRHSGLTALEARLLLSHVTGMSKEALLAHGLAELTETQSADYLALTTRRIQGEPIAYLLGEREFYGRPFKVTPDVLIPRPETEGLIDLALSQLGDKADVLDLGTGSGAIAVTLSCERPAWQIVATDNCRHALAVAKENNLRHGARVHFVESDWYKGLLADKFRHTFDLIVSNPPYIAADDQHLRQGDVAYEPKNALTDHANGLTALAIIIEGARQHLLSGGYLWVEHGYDQANQVRGLFHAAGFHHVRSVADLAGIERLTGGHI